MQVRIEQRGQRRRISAAPKQRLLTAPVVEAMVNLVVHCGFRPS